MYFKKVGGKTKHYGTLYGGGGGERFRLVVLTHLLYII